MKSTRGYTLMELLVVLTLIVTGGWLLVQTRQDAHQVAQVRQLLPAVEQSLTHVRARALRERRVWRICSRAAGGECQLPWQGSWQAFPVQGPALTPVMLPDLPPGWQLHWNSFRRRAWLDWQVGGDAADSNGTLTLCPPIPQDAALRQLVISRSGRIRTQMPHRLSAQALASARQICGWS